MSGHFALIRLDRVGPPHFDVDDGQSRWDTVVVVVVVVVVWPPRSIPSGSYTQSVIVIIYEVDSGQSRWVLLLLLMLLLLLLISI